MSDDTQHPDEEAVMSDDTQHPDQEAAMSDDAPHADEAFDRLAAADPGADAEPRLGVLRAKVAEQVEASAGVPARAAAGAQATEVRVPTDAAVVPGGPTGVSAGSPVRPTDLAAPHAGARRRRTGLLVAAAVAGVVAVGGGGFALGSLSGGPGAAGGAADDRAVAEAGGFAAPGSAQAPVTLGGSDYPAGGSAAGGGSAGSDAAAGTESATSAQEPAPAPGDAARSSAASDAAWAPFFGRTTFRAQGLSTQAGTAAAYAFDARPVANADTAARVAQAFGVAGQVQERDGTWSVGPFDGSGPQVYVTSDGIGSFGYSNPARDPWSCVQPAADGACPTPPATSVDDTAAAAALGDAMRSLGADPAQFEVTVSPRGDGNDAARWVSARRVIGGTLTTDTWSATVTDAGIAWMNGTLAHVVDLGSYDVVSPDEAVRRLGDPRFGQSSPIAYAAGAVAGEARTLAPAAVPAPPSSADRIAWPVTDVTITGARLALTQHWTTSGAVLFVPAYELTDADGNTWSVIAVTDAALDFTPPPAPGR